MKYTKEQEVMAHKLLGSLKCRLTTVAMLTYVSGLNNRFNVFYALLAAVFSYRNVKV